jgi:1-phosphatidylinositol-3-phosphate 5-kinase
MRKAPRLKTHKRRPAEYNESYSTIKSPRQVSRSFHKGLPSKIPGPAVPQSDYRSSSRQVSPDKRNFSAKVEIGKSPNITKGTSTPTRIKGKLNLRAIPREKTGNPSRATPALRRPSAKRNPSQSGKVNTLTRQFEKMSRDNERLNRRYSVIRGRRARPVASAKARVEVFENVRDAILDESGNSEVSEADDEEDRSRDTSTGPKESERSPSEAPETPTTATQETDAAMTSSATLETPTSSASGTPPVFESQPETPVTTAPQVSLPTSISDMDLVSSGPNHASLANAYHQFWPQQTISPHLLAEVEAEDPLADPEHIFRESDIVVRTDEPTSIIALTLE